MSIIIIFNKYLNVIFYNMFDLILIQIVFTSFITSNQRQDLLSAAGRVGEASHDLLANVQGQDTAVEEVLLAMAKGVANATAALVLKAKGQRSKDNSHVNRIQNVKAKQNNFVNIYHCYIIIKLII